VVVEVWLDGAWRVLDPLFGYAYRRPDGQLATAADLQQYPELVEQVVRADPEPFPHPYPLQEYNYQTVMRFNWNKLGILKTVQQWLGPTADEWEPPFIWNWRLTLLGYGVLSVASAGGVVWAIRGRRRIMKRAIEMVANLEPRDGQPSPPRNPPELCGGAVAEHGSVCRDAVAGANGQKPPSDPPLPAVPPAVESLL
jgi:hypothetical protein